MHFEPFPRVSFVLDALGGRGSLRAQYTTDRRSSATSRRAGRTCAPSAAREMSSSSPDESVTVQTSRSARDTSRRSDHFDGGEIVHGIRNRGGRKNYVVDSSPDDDDDDDDEDDQDVHVAKPKRVREAYGEVEGDEMEIDDEEMDIDAEGEEEDADGDVDMSASVASVAGQTIRVSQPAPRFAAQAAAAKMAVNEEDEEDEEEEEEEEDDDDDDDLSDPADSEDGDQMMTFGDETMADEDAEGEEIEVAREQDQDEEDEEEEEEEEDEDEEEEEDEDEDEEGEEEEEDAEGEVEVGGDIEMDSVDGSQEGSPDLTKMTKRQRARFEDEPQEYMKLSDEVQVKKHFTAEELSMRRQEMARRRRNLSEKRTEEVKMETINKLLKKQAPKINRKAAAAAAARADSPDEEGNKTNSTMVRWINNKNGSRVSVPGDILAGPAGSVFSSSGNPGAMSWGKLVQEVA
ncbi:hypothetical protein E4U36_007854 [Claviceps purpurea]|nr:hypothetical protein E4U51_007818 [Claviceps purpurea]KAG6176627.1 hypothetical protein E4U36_007854 [Claviceps purpurea]